MGLASRGSAPRVSIVELATPGVTFPRPKLKRMLLRSAQLLLETIGASELYVRTRAPEGAMVLMYHAVVRSTDRGRVDPRMAISVRAFERQMRFLSCHRRVISMSALVDQLKRGVRIAPGTVVITFDDGYRSLLDIVAPILHRYNLPAIAYLLTGYVSRGQSQFSDVLYAAFSFRSRHSLSLSDEGIEVPSLHPGLRTDRTAPAVLWTRRA